MARLVRNVKRHWFTTLPPVDPVELTGQTIVVTGGNDGIGFAVAKQLAVFHPGKLILASRNVAKSENAIKAIQSSVGSTPTIMEAWSLDLASIDSVTEFAARANRELAGLDILVLNAGVVRARFGLTRDGHEEMYFPD